MSGTCSKIMPAAAGGIVPAWRRPWRSSGRATAPIRQQTLDPPATSEPAMAPDIPAKKFAQLRSRVEYGMTVSQVADVYRVPVDTIERILQKA
jgi:hypothetical protein